MVRLRSQRWYSSDGQRRSRSIVATREFGVRRLISLCFLLALIVVMMQKSSDPKYVRNAFRTLGVPFDEQIDTQPHSAAHQPRSSAADVNAARKGPTDGSSSARSNTTSDPQWFATCQDLIPRLLDDQSNADTTLLAARWFSIQTSSNPEPARAFARLRSHSQQRLDALSKELADQSPNDANNTKNSAWQRRFDRFSILWQQMLTSLETKSQESVSQETVSLEDQTGANRSNGSTGDSPDPN